MGCSSCGCGGPCGCGCTPGCSPVNASDVILNPIPVTPRPCSALNPGCGGILPATPTPYYESTPQCKENHCQEIINNFFSASICTIAAFTMPACSDTASVTFPGVKVLPVGAYLWNETYGYLEVTSFNNRTGLATLLNHCNEGNAAVGTSIPGCTCFVVTDPPQQGQVNPFVPYLAENFTAPAVSDCTTITVTTAAGLIVGGEITLASGIYVLDEVLSPTTIVICNEGQGITPGTVVQARNEAGQLQYPIINIGENPCSVANVSEGKVLVCTDGTAKGLSGAAVGDALVISNSTTELGKYVTLGLDGDDTLTEVESFFLDENNPSHTAPIISYIITNPHPTKQMKIAVVASLVFNIQGNGSLSKPLTFVIQNQLNGGGYVDMKRNEMDWVLQEPDVGITKLPVELVAHTTYTLAPGGTLNLDYKAQMDALITDPVEGYDVNLFAFQVSYIAVSV